MVTNGPFVIILGLALLYAFFRIYIIKYESKYEISDKVIIGTLIKWQHQDNKYTLTVRGKERIKATYISDEEITFKLGMQLELKGVLTVPYQNTMPNTFNYLAYLKHNQIYYVMKIEVITIKDHKIGLFYQCKNYLYKRIDQFKYTKDYLKAFILGDKMDLNPDTYEVYQNNGIAHLFAISGMHINLLALLLLFGLKKIKIKKSTKYLIVISMLLFYTTLTNYAASIWRSMIFFILITINKLFGSKLETKSILFLTCSILIFWRPLVIFNLGFQYSAIVTFGLIVTSKYYRKSYFNKLLLTSIFAFLFSLPITLSNWYEVNLFGIINNLIFGPLISLVIYPLALITTFIKYLEPLFYILIKIMECLNFIAGKVSLPIIIPKVNFAWFLIYYLLLLLFITSNKKRYLIIGLLLILSFKLKYYFDSYTYVYFLDVGQGDSTLIYNRHEVILIDTGGLINYQVSNNTLQLLKSLGINKIDLLLLTHGDFDHLGDALNIISNFKVKKLMINSNQINELESKIIKVFPNHIKEYQGKFDLTFIHRDYGEDENASSIISLFKINNNQILLMGDATKKEELLLIKEYDIHADIIKLGHHGSKTSSDPFFLKTIGAKYAIISSGRNNLFKHPSAETIISLEALKIDYDNTAEVGTIKYVFRRNDYTKTVYPP